MRYVIDNRRVPVEFEGGSDFVSRTLRNAKNLLMTRMGEIPYDRLRGVDPKIYDLPLPKMREELLPEIDRVMLWEPDAKVISVEAQRQENGEVLIYATIEITAG